MQACFCGCTKSRCLLQVDSPEYAVPPELGVRAAYVPLLEFLLVGLQKYHSDEFGYKDDKEKAQRLEEMLDLFDDYEDESTEEHEQSAATLFTDLQEELQKNGFLSAMMTAVEQTAKAEQIAEQTKTEMESKAARVVAMNPIDGES